MNNEVTESLRQELAELRKKYNELKTIHEYQINQLINQLNKEVVSEVKKELREVVVYFENGNHIKTSMSSQLTDEEIKAYYKIGKIFNIGNGPEDNLQRVSNVKILK